MSFVAKYFQLDPVGSWIFEALQNFTPQPSDANCVFGVKAAGRVRQNRVLTQIDKVENVSTFGVDQSLTPDSNGNHLRSADLKALLHHVEGRILARADDQPRLQSVSSQNQWFVRHSEIRFLN